MNERSIESQKLINNAREALKRGDMNQARQLAERAAELTPKSEDPWLILAAVTDADESMGYLRKALAINPDSPRAKKGLEWATRKRGEKPQAESTPLPPRKKNRLLPILLILMGCAVFGFAAWSAVTSPVLASILNFSPTPQPVESKPFAQVMIPKPAVQANILPAAPTLVPTEAAAIPPTVEPTPEALPTPTAFSPTAVSQPGVVSAEIISDTPTPEFTEPTVAPYVPPQMADGTHWIDVDLSQQRLYAYAGDTLMNSFVVSTGTWQTPTVTGEFKVWVKLRSSSMSGPGYYLPDVPYVMYFYGDYGIHGTYWHNNFGTPMSHGCVNLTIPDAEWVYNFASVGTVVNVHD